MSRKAFNFSLPDENGKTLSLSDFLGKWVAVYFYPKDETPVCTVEACSFRDNYADLNNHGIVVLGISADDTKSHKKFSERHSLPFSLLFDNDGEVAKEYGAYKKAIIPGWSPIQRKTYLINPKGELVKPYETMNVASHPKEIIEDVKSLKQSLS